LLAALAEFGVYGADLSGDVNSDGLVGVDDILTLLANYGESCN